MSSKRRLSQNISASATKLRLDSLNKILKLDSSKTKKQRKDELNKQVSRIALTELLRNTPTTICNTLPDFKTFLSNKDNVNIFREFLKSQYCHENIDFYLACERYNKLNPETVGKEMIKFMANQIYNDYLSKDARQPINIDYKCIQYIREHLKDPKPDLLHDAQIEVFNLMKADCYPRFCKTWQMDRDTAQKILSEKPVESTPMSNKTITSISTSSSRVLGPTNLITPSSSCSHTPASRSISSRDHRRKSIMINSNKRCPEECPYNTVGLPCQTHDVKVQEPQEPPRTRVKKRSFRSSFNVDLDNGLDLRRIHKVPDASDNFPPPLPPKPSDVYTRDVMNKKYQPFVGKVFHV